MVCMLFFSIIKSMICLVTFIYVRNRIIVIQHHESTILFLIPYVFLFSLFIYLFIYAWICTVQLLHLTTNLFAGI